MPEFYHYLKFLDDHQTELTRTQRRQLNIRRLIVQSLEVLQQSLHDAAEKHEVQQAALNHARSMFANAVDAPYRAVRRRITQTDAYRKYVSSRVAGLTDESRGAARKAILADLTPRPTAFELALAELDGVLPVVLNPNPRVDSESTRTA